MTDKCNGPGPHSVAKALTMWIGLFSPSPEPRIVLPSTASVPVLTAGTRPPAQRRKADSKDFGFRMRNTRLKVSWDGMPPSSLRKRLSQVSLLWAQKAISSKLFMSHSTAQTAIVRISWRSCRRP